MILKGVCLVNNIVWNKYKVQLNWYKQKKKTPLKHCKYTSSISNAQRANQRENGAQRSSMNILITRCSGKNSNKWWIFNVKKKQTIPVQKNI